jgi:uncharacterized protein YjbJ (UPF0337 family)
VRRGLPPSVTRTSRGSYYIQAAKVYREGAAPATQLLELTPQDRLARGLRLGKATGAIRTRAGHTFNSSRSQHMNWDRIEGNWKQFKGKAKQQWGKLTDDQLDMIAGRRDELAGKIQEQYGISKDEAEKQLNEFAKRYRDLDSKY